MKHRIKIKKGLFGSRYFYLNDKTRIRHGFALVGIGTTYSLQRRRRCGWRRGAWVFSKQFEDKSLVELVNYLK